MLPRLLRAQQLRGYLERNFEQMSPSMGTIGAWRSYLQKATQSASSDVEGLESIRLNSLGYTGPTLADQWRKFFNSEGLGAKTLGDAARHYFTMGADEGLPANDDPTFDGGGQPIGLLLVLTYP